LRSGGGGGGQVGVGSRWGRVNGFSEPPYARHSVYAIVGPGDGWVSLSAHSAAVCPAVNLLLHCKKKVNDFPVPSRDVAYQTLPGRE
jgi:hypothetical protein